MLGKLAYRNTKRNIKDYLIYLITVTASFSLIFAFNLVANSDEIVKLCSSMDAFKNSLFAVNILIIFVICFLINYTTKFMFEKRSKETKTPPPPPPPPPPPQNPPPPKTQKKKPK